MDCWGPVVTHIRVGTPPRDNSWAMPMHWFTPVQLQNGFQGGWVSFSPQKGWIDNATLPINIQNRESFSTRGCAAWNVGFLSSWLAESEAREGNTTTNRKAWIFYSTGFKLQLEHYCNDLNDHWSSRFVERFYFCLEEGKKKKEKQMNTFSIILFWCNLLGFFCLLSEELWGGKRPVLRDGRFLT